jgi:hypothetical protein
MAPTNRAFVLALTSLLLVVHSGRTEDRAKMTARLGALPARIIKDKRTDSDVVDTLFPAAVARPASREEKTRIVKDLAGAKDREGAVRDVLWALVNSKEFTLLHNLTTPAEVEAVWKDISNVWTKN